MNQEKIWNYYQSDGSASFDGSYLRLHFLASKCKRGERVLNIGIGGCIFEKIALQKGLDIYSLDPSEEAIKNLQKQIGNEKAKIGTSDAIPFDDNFFDVVVMSEVLEHLDERVCKDTLSEVYRVLKKNARFMGTVPNDEKLNESLVVCPDCGHLFHRWGHVQQFNKSSLYQLLSNKFSNVEVMKKGWLSREKLNIKNWIYSKLNDLLYKFDMRTYYGNLFFHCKK